MHRSTRSLRPLGRFITVFTALTLVLSVVPEADAKRKRKKRRGKKAKVLKPIDDSFLSPVERKVWHELRLLRQSPRAYAVKVRAFRAKYEGINVRVGDIMLETNEGTKAVDEALAVMAKHKRGKKLKLLKDLSSAAKEHATYLGVSGQASHIDGQGNGPGARLDQYGDWAPRNAQILSFQFQDPASIVAWLLTNDGIASRGYRFSLLSKKFKLGGVGCAAHKVHKFTCVILLTEKFKPHPGGPRKLPKGQLKIYQEGK